MMVLVLALSRKVEYLIVTNIRNIVQQAVMKTPNVHLHPESHRMNRVHVDNIYAIVMMRIHFVLKTLMAELVSILQFVLKPMV